MSVRYHFQFHENRWDHKPRVTPPPFDVTGLDFAGSVMMIKHGRARKPVHVKSYVSLFVCLVEPLGWSHWI